MENETKRRKGKRPNGEGSYRERNDGTWECRITLPNGKRKSLYGKTRDEVIAARKKAEREIENGRDLSQRTMTVHAFLTDWLENTVRHSLRPKTHHSYAQLVRLHIVPRIGRIDLDELTPQHVQRMMSEMTKAGLSPRTVQYTRAVLRRALGFALKWGIVSRNVATLVEPPRSARKPVQPLTAAQARRLLDHVRDSDPRLFALITVAFLTGMRQAELLGLRWSRLDLDRALLRVTHTVQRIDGEWQFVEPKSRSSVRNLSLPPSAVTVLRAHRDAQTFERRAAGDSWRELDLVFTTAKGTPFEPSNLNGRLHRALDACALPRQGMHSLRHACASVLLEQGVSPRVVMEQLGHSQISLTMDTYAHVMPTMLHDAANALESALNPAKAS